ncbi:SIRT3 [Symbiodinium sp. KB8]|nr:SIRT3 [Symbiodinium sp. KB8]
MGCASSTAEVAKASRAAWQSFFRLDGLPVSLTVDQDQKNLRLRIVGLDCAEELPLLEHAVLKRDLTIKAATLIKIGAHVDQSFELAPVYHSPVRKYLMPKKHEVNEVTVSSSSADEVRKVVPTAVAALQDVAEIVKVLLIAALLKTDANAISDIFFMTPDLEANGQSKTVDLLEAEFKLAVFDQLQKNTSTISRASSIPPHKTVTEHVSEQAAGHQSQHLPLALRELQNGLEYQLHGPVSSGLTITGFEKFVGIGLAQKSLKDALGFKDTHTTESKPLILEIRTCFVSEQKVKSTGQLAEIQHFWEHTIMQKEQFANFVSWLDISERTWTIDRVFLNGILPAGHRYGAQAIAEHLLAPPLLFFQSKKESQSPSSEAFLNSMPDLEKLVVADVVNWNTYLLMAVCGRTEAEARQKLGDVLDFALSTELKAASLKKETLLKGSTLEVFQSTVLGKMVSSALKLWNEKLQRSVKMVSAEVVYGEGDEMIFGERRPRMAVVVQLAEEHAELRAKQKFGAVKEVVESERDSPMHGMGKFLEGAWVSHERVQFPGTNNAQQYFAGLSSVMTCFMHELQVERGLSCYAVAAEPTVLVTAGERLQNQRTRTDKAVQQLSEILRLAPALQEKGYIQSKHKDLLAVQEISVGLVLQRGRVNDAMRHVTPSWISRYETVCMGDTGYHSLIDRIMKTIVQALSFAAEGLESPEAKQVPDRCAFLLKCKEAVGRERGLMAAKSRSKLDDESRAKQLFKETTEGGEEALKRILEDKLLGPAPESQTLSDALAEARLLYTNDAKVPSDRAVELFERFTQWIQLAYGHIQTEIEALSEDIPAESTALARPEMQLGVQFEEQVDDGPLGLLLADMAANAFKNVVVMAGAGISVSANLPDFRSKGGLYDQLRQTTNITTPETIFTRQFLKEQPLLFYKVMQQLRADHVSPTLTHEFLKRLQDKKILRRVYTQNIDCLERKVGIQESLLVECHGTTRRARCDECRTFISKEEYFDQADPPRCRCGSALRPDIVLFGEPLPESFSQHKSDFQNADLLIIMGTSLKVHPFASLPKLIKPTCALLVINREFPQSLQLHRQVRTLRSRLSGTKLRKHVFLGGDCDTSVRWLMQEQGWEQRAIQVSV